jgi:hypothetical protein
MSSLEWSVIPEVRRMSYAVVIQVEIDPDSDRQHRHAVLNEFVLPETRALPGFEKGIWMNDGAGTGACVVVFDSETHARNAIDSLTPAGSPPILTSGVYEVELEV